MAISTVGDNTDVDVNLVVPDDDVVRDDDEEDDGALNIVAAYA